MRYESKSLTIFGNFKMAEYSRRMNEKTGNGIITKGENNENWASNRYVKFFCINTGLKHRMI